MHVTCDHHGSRTTLDGFSCVSNHQILVFILWGRCESTALPIYLFKGFLKFFPAKRAWSPSSSSILQKQTFIFMLFKENEYATVVKTICIPLKFKKACKCAFYLERSL